MWMGCNKLPIILIDVYVISILINAEQKLSEKGGQGVAQVEQE